MPSSAFAGYMFAATEHVGAPETIFLSQAIRFRGRVEDTRWVRFAYSSPVPLLNEFSSGAEPPLQFDSPFEYPLFARFSEAGHIILIAAKRYIVEHSLERERMDRARLDIGHRAVPLHRVRVAIHRLVTGLVRNPSPYALTRVDANIPVGESLKFLVFHGDDIGQSGTFNKISPSLRFYACGLKKRAAKVEQLHIDSQGRIRCTRPDQSNPRIVDGMLGHLYAKGYLKTDRELWADR